MSNTVLSRYLNPEVLGRIAHRHIEPRGLVLGNLAGSHKSPLAGFAVEFAGHREYVRGDDPKHIDWRLYYTRDKYFVKQYEMETNFVCHLVLDVSASMRYGEGAEQKLLYAGQAATTLGYAIIGQSDKVSLATFDEQVLGFIPPGNSLAQIVKLTDHLESIEPRQKTRMGDCLTELTGRMRRREIVMIFSDFLTDLEALEPALQWLRFHQHEVVLFHVLHNDELEFDFDGQLKFQGLESADEYMAEPADLRAAYLESLHRFTDRLDEICAQNRIERVLLNTRLDMSGQLVDYLNQRSLLNRGR